MNKSTVKSPSPSRTYVIRLDVDNFTHYKFKKFTLPSEYENTCENASWFFYNRLDFSSCGAHAFSFEDYCNIVDMENEK